MVGVVVFVWVRVRALVQAHARAPLHTSVHQPCSGIECANMHQVALTQLGVLLAYEHSTVEHMSTKQASIRASCVGVCGDRAHLDVGDASSGPRRLTAPPSSFW
jgi:hypothetical protein